MIIAPQSDWIAESNATFAKSWDIGYREDNFSNPLQDNIVNFAWSQS